MLKFALLVCCLSALLLVSVSGAPQKRLACDFGDAVCASACYIQGRTHGGCCGQKYTKCHGTCYCNGSGYEHRCHFCDIN